MEMVHRPSPVLMAALLDDFNCLGNAFVGFHFCVSKGIETAQDVVMPHGRKGKARPFAIDDLAVRQSSKHSPLEEILVGFPARFRDGSTSSPRALVFQQSFENANRGIERGART